MIQNLDIDTWNLKLKLNLTPVTLISGKNGIGKTRVLNYIKENYVATYIINLKPFLINKSMIINLKNFKNTIFLIDEIENGIHYTEINKIWELLFELAKLNNCQIIATTHSWEFASYVINQSKENQKLFSFVNIARLKNGELVSATYNNQEFAYAIENNTEIR